MNVSNPDTAAIANPLARTPGPAPEVPQGPPAEIPARPAETPPPVPEIPRPAPGTPDPKPSEVPEPEKSARIR